MKIIDDFKKSKTIRLAWAQKALGALTLISANAGYFETSMAPWLFGTLLIGLGLANNYLRQVTTQSLDKK